MQPGSDTANLSIFGYDPVESYSGRAPLEAISMGIEMGTEDAAFRCNIVNIDNNIMEDYSAGHIASEISEVIMEQMARAIMINGIEFHAGVSYRNIVIWRDFPHKSVPGTTPPHDILGKNISEYLPEGKGMDILNEIMSKSVDIISSSPEIEKAKAEFQGSPSSVWLWGGGRKPAMKTLQERFGLHGYTISAVDLIHGIGKTAGLKPIQVEGATGYIDTNYTGKADALLAALDEANFVYLHVESPDESGHGGNVDNKIKAIEDFDEKVVGRVVDGIKKYDNYTVMVLPDHPTPVSLRTHTAEPVPFLHLQ